VTEFLLKLIDLAANLAPVRIVPAWAVGLYMVAGKYRGTVGPGLKLLIPGLCEIIKVPVVPGIATTPSQNVTLKGGQHLSYSASITFVVVDARKAYLEVDRYGETVVELVSRKVSDGLAKADLADLEAGRARGRFTRRLRRRLDAACRKYGVSVTDLGFNNFLLDVPAVRLLLDPSVLLSGNHFSS
jgi:regulator of protease activity HflC (stomatin/prohibitin superfamily)